MHPEITSYESHITIEPVFGERFYLFEQLCAPYKFRPAELLLQKAREATPQRSNKDSFCTGHSKTFDDLQSRTINLVTCLKEHGFEVWRYKIEGMLVDERTPPLVKITT
jgi:hypothetical protein